MCHLNIVQGDFVFADWDRNGWSDFKKKEHELRVQGFRKVEREFDSQNMYETYRKKKKRVTLTMMLS